MKIIDAIGVNKYLIKCECGRHFKYRSAKWSPGILRTVMCPKCKGTAKLDVLREEYANIQG